MVHGNILSCIHFIAILSIVSGFSYNLNPNQNHYPYQPYQQQQYPHPPTPPLQPSRNIKRMTADDNARPRDTWGQTTSQQQYFQNPYPHPQQPQQQGGFYPNHPGGTNYFSSTQPTPNGAVINIFKSRNGQGGMGGMGAALTRQTGQGVQGVQPQHASISVSKMPRTDDGQDNVNVVPGKKVKVLICRLQQGQA